MKLSKFLIAGLMIFCSNAKAGLLTLNSDQYLEIQLEFSSTPLAQFDTLWASISNVSPMFDLQNPTLSLYHGQTLLAADTFDFFNSGPHYGANF